LFALSCAKTQSALPELRWETDVVCKNLIRFTALGLLLGVAAGVTNAEIIAYWPFDEGTGYYNTKGDYVYQILDEKSNTFSEGELSCVRN